MKVTEKQIERMAYWIFQELKEQNLVSFKTQEAEAFQKALSIINQNFLEEEDLNEEVHQMMDDLDRQNPGSFEKYKMFPMLKKKLAEQKGIIL